MLIYILLSKRKVLIHRVILVAHYSICNLSKYHYWLPFTKFIFVFMTICSHQYVRTASSDLCEENRIKQVWFCPHLATIDIFSLFNHASNYQDFVNPSVQIVCQSCCEHVKKIFWHNSTRSYRLTSIFQNSAYTL